MNNEISDDSSDISGKAFDRAEKPSSKSQTGVMVVIGLIMFGAALYYIRHVLQDYSIKQIINSLQSVSLISICLAILATLTSFLAVAGYDSLALRYSGTIIPLRKTIFASFSAYAVSNTLGMNGLTGNAVRYRLYSSLGLEALDVAVIAFITASFVFVSGMTLTGLGLLSDSGVFEQIFHLPIWASLLLGVTSTILAGLGLVFLLKGAEAWRLKGSSTPKAGKKLVFSQWSVGVLDWIAAAAVLYFLLPQGTEFTFLAIVPIFVVAHFIGSISGLPGGIGVFEAVFLLLIPSGNEVAVAGGLVAYRAIYYVMPLIISVLVLALHQGLKSKDRLRAGSERTTDFLETIAPIVYATLTFITGSIMLISAATPNLLRHVKFVLKFLPGSVLELSHLAASAVGTLLLLAALGLRRRLQNACRLAIILFLIGAIVTFTKGGDIRGSILMIGLAGCLYLSREAFYRKGRLRELRLSLPRLGVLLGAGGLALWSGFYAYMNKDYSNDLWWTFALQEDASRFLRAAALVGAMLLVYFLWRLLQPAPAENRPNASEDVLEKVRAVIAGAEGSTPEANLALIGDKQFLFSDSGQSFIMYGVVGRNWVAMGEPVGLESERKELMWKFRHSADLWDAWPSFYSIRGQHLNDFIDLGLTVQKIGELALVPIEGYTLEGSSKSRFRQTRNRAIRDGCSFDVIYPAGDSPEMDRLEVISREWLKAHHGKEKGFSLGRFDRKTLAGAPIAIVRKDEQIVAFTNLWMTPDKSEVSLDLMRHIDVGVNGLMDFLFAEMMLWGGAQGYQYFSLGLAPLSGLEAHKLAPLMSKIGAMIFKHGGRFYSFAGLRAFKEKFNPEWHPVYLAAPSQLVIPKALGNLTLLNSGGVLGLIQRES